MKKTTILSVIAAAAMVPVAVAQEPAPTPPAPETATPTFRISKRVFVNGEEVFSEDAEEKMKSLGFMLAQKLLAAKVSTTEATPAPAAEAAPAPSESPEAKPEQPQTVRVVRNGHIVATPATDVPAATCPNCAAPKKEAPRPRVQHRRHHHAAAPSNRPRYYGQPGVEAMPPCAKRHGRVIRQVSVYQPAAAKPAPTQPENAPEPKAVKVIINGVEAIVPWGPDGLNFTVKPL